MKGNKPLTSLLLMFAFGSLVTSCQPKTSSSKTNSGTSNLPSLGTTGSSTGSSTGLTTGSTTGSSTGSSCPWGTGSEAGISDNGQTISYYKLNSPPAVMHGANSWEVGFSTDSDLPPNYNQNIFFTDQRFNVRVIPRRTQRGTDSKGRYCAFIDSPFTKMNIGVVVRSRDASPGVGAYYQFKDVPINCPSKVREFIGQIPNTPDPLVIDILNVESDHACILHQSQTDPRTGTNYTYEDGVSRGYCPYDQVSSTECFEVEVQFSTDTTTNLPGTRVN